MAATMRSRFTVPRGDRAARLAGALLASVLLWLPVRQADADAESPAAEAPQPSAAESVPVDSSTVVADSLEAGAIDSAATKACAVDTDTLDAATRTLGFRHPNLYGGLRLDGSIGILREVDRRWRLKTFFAHVAPSRGEPEREDSE